MTNILEKKYIHIAFAVNNVFVPYLIVTIKSILENNKQNNIVIHILTDYISKKKRKDLTTSVKDYNNVELIIYQVDDCCLKGLYLGRWPIHTWYRILLPIILPKHIERVLYLDVDTVVVSELNELYFYEMEDSAIAGVLDDSTYDDEPYLRLGYEKSLLYVCCGVLLINLAYWRKYDMANELIEWARANISKLKFPDQDSINFVFRNKKKILPMKYGIVQNWFINKNFYRSCDLEELKMCIKSPVVIHFAGGFYPWIKDIKHHILNEYWIKYNKMLQKPVRLKYKSKGLMFCKIFIWDILHPDYQRKYPISDELTKILDMSSN